MRKIVSLTLVSGLLMSTSALCSSLNINGENNSPKRQSNFRVSDSKHQKLDQEKGSTSSASQEAYIKKEPGLEEEPNRLKSFKDIKRQLPNFNPHHGETNCLPCSTSFVHWVNTGILRPAPDNAPDGYNIQSTDRIAQLLDQEQAQHLAPAPLVIQLEPDDVIQEYIDLEDRKVTFIPTTFDQLENYLRGCRLKDVSDGSYQVGMIYMAYKQESSTGHFLNFYVAQAHGFAKQMQMIDSQAGTMQKVSKFINQNKNTFKDPIYVWYQGNSASRSPSPIFIKEEFIEPSTPQTPAKPVIAVSTEENNEQYIEASTIISAKISGLNQQEKIDYFYNTINDPKTPATLRALCVINLTNMHLKDANANISAIYVTKHLQELLLNPIDIQTKDTAAYYLGVMRVTGRAPSVTDEQAVAYLKQAATSQLSNQQTKEAAAYYLGVMRVTGRAPSVTDEQAVAYLKQAATSQLSNQQRKDNAAYYLGFMRYNDRAPSVTDEQAVAYLKQAATSQLSNQQRKDSAAYYLGFMRYNDRAPSVTDEQAVAYLKQAATSQLLTQHAKEAAAYYLGVMRYNDRAPSVTDEQAVAYLKQAVTSQLLTQQTKEAAAYYLGVMRVTGRAPSVTDEQAVAYLKQAATSQLSNQQRKDNAAYYLGVMRVTGRAPSVTDEQAVAYLKQAATSQLLTQHAKEAAAYYLGVMRVTGRAPSVTDEQAVAYLKQAATSQLSNQQRKDNATRYLQYKQADNRIILPTAKAPLDVVNPRPAKTAPTPNFGLPLLPRTPLNSLPGKIAPNPAPHPLHQVAPGVVPTSMIEELIKIKHNNQQQIQAGFELAEYRVNNLTTRIDDATAREYLGQYMGSTTDKLKLQKALNLMQKLCDRM